MNLEHIEFKLLANKFKNAEVCVIARKDLCVHPDYQMREKMDHHVIEQYAANIEELPAVEAFEIKGLFYLVDGFHRYFAHEMAEAKDIKIKSITGTKEEAMRYAMAANFQHLEAGSKPTKGDQAKAILRMCETMNFGYDSKSVIPQLKDWGIKCTDRYLRQITEKVREDIEAKRDHEISLLALEGKTQRQIAEQLSCSVGYVNKVLSRVHERNSSVCEHNDIASYMTTTAKSLFNFHGEPLALEDIGFDEEDDTTPIVNPAEAFNKALREADSNLQTTNSNSKKTTQPKAAKPLRNEASLIEALAAIADHVASGQKLPL